MTAERIAGRDAAAQRGNATAVHESVKPGDSLGAAAGTAYRDATARRGDAAARHGSM